MRTESVVTRRRRGTAARLPSCDAPGGDRSALGRARSRPRAPRAPGPAAGGRSPGCAAAGLDEAVPRAPRPAGDAGRARAGARRRRTSTSSRRSAPGAAARSIADTAASAASWDAALLAAGAGLAAVDALEAGDGHRRVLRGPAARPPRRARPTRWASACSTTSRSPRPRSATAGERVLDRRLGRAPRQRHPGHVLDRPRRACTCRCTSGRSIRAPAGSTTSGAGRRARAHRQLPAPGGRDRRRLPRRARQGGRAARRAVRARLGAGLGRVRRPPRRPAHRPRAPAGDFADLAARVQRIGARRAGRWRSSRAATTSRRSAIRSRRRRRPWSEGRDGRNRRPRAAPAPWSCGPSATSTTRDALAG